MNTKSPNKLMKERMKSKCNYDPAIATPSATTKNATSNMFYQTKTEFNNNPEFSKTKYPIEEYKEDDILDEEEKASKNFVEDLMKKSIEMIHKNESGDNLLRASIKEDNDMSEKSINKNTDKHMETVSEVKEPTPMATPLGTQDNITKRTINNEDRYEKFIDKSESSASKGNGLMKASKNFVNNVFKQSVEINDNNFLNKQQEQNVDERRISSLSNLTKNQEEKSTIRNFVGDMMRTSLENLDD